MKAKTLIHQNDLPFIDLSLLFDLCEDDMESILEMVDIFIDSLDQIIQQLNLSCEAKNAEQVYMYAHKAKSSLSIVQIKPLWQIMDILEEEARAKIWKQHWTSSIQKLSTIWQQIPEMLQQWKQTHIQTQPVQK